MICLRGYFSDLLSSLTVRRATSKRVRAREVCAFPTTVVLRGSILEWWGSSSAGPGPTTRALKRTGRIVGVYFFTASKLLSNRVCRVPRAKVHLRPTRSTDHTLEDRVTKRSTFPGAQRRSRCCGYRGSDFPRMRRIRSSPRLGSDCHRSSRDNSCWRRTRARMRWWVDPSAAL